MARPHIEFIHAQDLPWLQGVLPDALGRLDAKVLSRDDDTGACSIILRYPPGWRDDTVSHFAAAHEFYVLDGAIVRDGQSYGIESYGYFPAGHTTRSAASPEGAVVLTFFDATPVSVAGEGLVAQDPDAPAIPYINLLEMPWSSKGIDPDVQFLRIVHKVLRHNKATGDKTIVLDGGAHTHPRDWHEKALAHPCVEEMFLLSGDIVGERGLMTAGAYFWRPPHEWHGPFGSRYGNVSLIRFVGGHHVNIWGDESLRFQYDPPHAPKLPAALEPFRGSGRSFARPF